jgi:hypothetical protein
MLSWMVTNKAKLITLGSLERLCNHLSGMTWLWAVEADDEYCYITFNNPDEYGKDRPCTIRFPVVTTLGKNELEKVILLDGIVANQTEYSQYEYFDEDSGEPYCEEDSEYDWSACMEPIFATIEKAANHELNLNPNPGM